MRGEIRQIHPRKGGGSPQDPTPRRLAAIMAADIAGYSRLMKIDEEGTHARLRRILRELIEPTIAEHDGRLVKTTGDGFIAIFDSPVEAVRCAIVIQQSMVGRNASLPPSKRSSTGSASISATSSWTPMTCSGMASMSRCASRGSQIPAKSISRAASTSRSSTSSFAAISRSATASQEHHRPGEGVPRAARSGGFHEGAEAARDHFRAAGEPRSSSRLPWASGTR